LRVSPSLSSHDLGNVRGYAFRLTLALARFLGELRIPSTGTSRGARQSSARPFIHSLNILVRHVRLYGFNHKRTLAQFEVAWRELKQAVPRNKSGFVLGVSGDQLLLDGVALETGHAERGFAQLLTASGLSSIQFFHGVTSQEFEKLVQAFA